MDIICYLDYQLLFFITIVVSSAIHPKMIGKITHCTEARGTDSFNEIEIDNGVNVVLQQGENTKFPYKTWNNIPTILKRKLKTACYISYVENFSAMDGLIIVIPL